MGMVPFDYRANPLENNTAQYYPLWWDSMEACSHRRANLDAIQWWYWPTDSGWYLPNIEEHIVGHYDRARNDIWVVERSLTEQSLVMHEMLHALLPEPGHSGAVWDQCGVRRGMR
jgi:hypothetical protein